MKTFRKTWLHEVFIEAEDAKQAQEIWANLELGYLNQERESKKISAHSFVEYLRTEDEMNQDINQ